MWGGKENSAFCGIWTHEYEYIRTWVELLRPLGQECFHIFLHKTFLTNILLLFCHDNYDTLCLTRCLLFNPLPTFPSHTYITRQNYVSFEKYMIEIMIIIIIYLPQFQFKLLWKIITNSQRSKNHSCTVNPNEIPTSK